jgi:hypothetical protein
MPEGPRLVTVGLVTGYDPTLDNGWAAVQADVTTLGDAVPVTFELGYWMIQPPGFPVRPDLTGTEQPSQFVGGRDNCGDVVELLDGTQTQVILTLDTIPYTAWWYVPQGTTLNVLRCEATALVAGGIASYA